MKKFNHFGLREIIVNFVMNQVAIFKRTLKY